MSQENLKAALIKTIESIKSNPATANVVFRAETKLEDGVRCSAKVREFTPLVVDEPPELGGTNAAMNPVELVLAALGTCQEIMYAAYAAVMGIPLEEVKVDVKGYLDLRGLFGLDDTVPPGYKRITFNTTIKSPADEATLLQLIKTVERHCPLLDILSRAQEVSGAAIVNGKQAHSFAGTTYQAAA
jgi:uncharacterized OsmC-like protein